HISKGEGKPNPKNLLTATAKYRSGTLRHTENLHCVSSESCSRHNQGGHKNTVHLHPSSVEDSPSQSIPGNFLKWHPESQALWLSWQQARRDSVSSKSLSE